MVSVLLSRLRQTRRVDGTGGDGGRDCYFSDEDGTDVYELKSFTGRMRRAQRLQVERSLGRGIANSPRSWTLVVPIDPNPAEESWFDTLKADHTGTRLEWLGETWLKDQLARFPDIIRYFSGAAEEVIRILTAIREEDALPDDAAGLVQRFAGQAARLNEIDPYYWFEFTIAGESATVTAHPRYPDAPRDRPITLAVSLQFDDSSDQQETRSAFMDSMKFGTPVTIPPSSISSLALDAPAGLGGEYQSGTLMLDGTFQPTSEQPTTVVLRVPAHPPIRRMVSLNVVERSAGGGGLRLLARDQSGFLTLELRFDFSQQTSQANLTYHHHDSALPRDVVPVLRLCAEIAAGTEMAATDPAGNVIVRFQGPFGFAQPEAYIHCAELLAEVQQMAGVAFPLPDAFSTEDQHNMLYARAILHGEAVEAEWAGETKPMAAAAVDMLLSQTGQNGDQFALTVVIPQIVPAAGGQLPVGTVLQFMPSARVANLDEVRAWRAADVAGTVDVQLVPGETNKVTVRSAPTGDPVLPAAPSASRP